MVRRGDYSFVQIHQNDRTWTLVQAPVATAILSFTSCHSALAALAAQRAATLTLRGTQHIITQIAVIVKFKLKFNHGRNTGTTYTIAARLSKPQQQHSDCPVGCRRLQLWLAYTLFRCSSLIFTCCELWVRRKKNRRLSVVLGFCRYEQSIQHTRSTTRSISWLKYPKVYDISLWPSRYHVN